jgi:hypothetical protein
MGHGLGFGDGLLSLAVGDGYGFGLFGWTRMGLVLCEIKTMVVLGLWSKSQEAHGFGGI